MGDLWAVEDMQDMWPVKDIHVWPVKDIHVWPIKDIAIGPWRALR